MPPDTRQRRPHHRGAADAECATTGNRILRQRWLGTVLYSSEPRAVAVGYASYDVIMLGLTPHDRSRCPRCQAVGA
jgi:hypothetical protein